MYKAKIHLPDITDLHAASKSQVFAEICLIRDQYVDLLALRLYGGM